MEKAEFPEWKEGMKIKAIPGSGEGYGVYFLSSEEWFEPIGPLTITPMGKADWSSDKLHFSVSQPYKLSETAMRRLCNARGT